MDLILWIVKEHYLLQPEPSSMGKKAPRKEEINGKGKIRRQGARTLYREVG